MRQASQCQASFHTFCRSEKLARDRALFRAPGRRHLQPPMAAHLPLCIYLRSPAHRKGGVLFSGIPSSQKKAQIMNFNCAPATPTLGLKQVPHPRLRTGAPCALLRVQQLPHPAALLIQWWPQRRLFHSAAAVAAYFAGPARRHFPGSPHHSLHDRYSSKYCHRCPPKFHHLCRECYCCHCCWPAGCAAQAQI